MNTIRLDRFFTACAVFSRKEAAEAVKRGRVAVDGIPAVRPDAPVNPFSQTITLDGVPVIYREFQYIMMNKPAGVVSATDHPGDMTVLDLLPENLRNIGLFPCGRLDKSTTGFVLLTNDGQRGHRLLSPKHHAEKVYRFRVKFPLSEEDCAKLSHGVVIEADSIAPSYETAPCRIQPDNDRLGGIIVLTEGKYHQIKRMAEAVHNQITALSRISFAGISLDSCLAPGAWRYLTAEEEKQLLAVSDASVSAAARNIQKD